MIQKDFNTFTKTLSTWYRENGRKLPWRKKNISAYEVWVSEIMLQQTQVSRVEKFYKKFLKRFPGVTPLSKASWEEFLSYYEGLGYYRRGENMLETAKIVAGEYGGHFPETKNELMKLPGVGEYTASAILAFAFDESVLAKDTNIKRVFGRYFGSDTVSNEKAVGQFEEFLKDSEYSGREVNSALMDFGSMVCVSKPNKKDHACPFGEKCGCFQGVESETAIKKERFPAGQARTYIFLHKEHREYYSQNKKTYKPFLLPRGYVSRKDIKEYFWDTFELVVSVRPPFSKGFEGEESRYFVNAQILSGENIFYIHDASVAKKKKEILVSCLR